MHRLIPKILSSKPWLLPVLGFLLFVALWAAFIVVAMHHTPREVSRHAIRAGASAAWPHMA